MRYRLMLNLLLAMTVGNRLAVNAELSAPVVEKAQERESPPIAPSIAPSISSWAALARADLQFIYQSIQETHPGVVDSLNPSFASSLEAAYQKAIGSLNSVYSFETMDCLLKSFIATFKDSHLFLRPLFQPTKIGWPGFILSYRQGHFFVDHLYAKQDFQSGLPPLQARLISIDGKDPKSAMLERVFPYVVEDPQIEASWDFLAPLFLLQNPVLTPIEQCQLLVEGKEVNLTLKWEEADSGQFFADLKAHLSQLSQGNRRSYNSFEFAPGCIWISLPSFQPKSQSDLNFLNSLLNQLSAVRDKKSIVFDVRGNGGGQSIWAEEIVRRLYGDALFEQVLSTFPEYYVEYRASAKVEAHLQALLKIVVKQFGAHSKEALEVMEDLKGVQATKSRGKALYRSRSSYRIFKDHLKGDKEDITPCKAQVFLLTDFKCASSCLMFADMLLPMPNAYQIGLPTKVDGSCYTEPYLVNLPSGLYQMGCPTKVKRNLPRPVNQPHLPKYRYEGNLFDDQAVQNWVLDLIKGTQ